jgi:hypothetical protein
MVTAMIVVAESEGRAPDGPANRDGNGCSRKAVSMTSVSDEMI